MPGFAIGSKIRDLRIKNGLTQEELANRSELSKGCLLYTSQILSVRFYNIGRTCEAVV